MPYVIAKQKIFPLVKEIGDILTEEWLEVATCATEVVGSMGGQFSMTKDDMLGNIKKIRTKFDTDKEKFKRFQDLLQDELDKKEDSKDKSGTVGGLWLKRGLEYLCEVFYELVLEHENSKLPGGKSESSSVKVACQNAYEITLKQYHNIITKGLVKAALLISPYKETFMANLASGEKDKVDEVVDELKVYEAALRAYIVVVRQLYNHFGNKDSGIDTAEKRMEKKSS